MVRHLRFVRDHHRRVRRVALAVDGALAGLAAGVAGHFVHAQLRRFGYDRLDDAITWASGRDGQDATAPAQEPGRGELGNRHVPEPV
jgi:hypothetical protein